jgi:FkbM family methyltransferase
VCAAGCGDACEARAPFASVSTCDSARFAGLFPREPPAHTGDEAREDSGSAWAQELALGASKDAAALAARRAAGEMDGFCPRRLVARNFSAAPSRFAWGWRDGEAANASVAALACFWTMMGSRDLGGRTMKACVTDPEVDHMSKYLHESGTYSGAEGMDELAFLNPCPPSSPFVIDVGLNLGSFSLLALQMGCHVIAFEPVLRNLGRVARTVLANPGLAARVHLLKNAVGAQRADSVPMRYSPQNSGGSAVDQRLAGEEGIERVAMVVLDDLFFAPAPAQAPGSADADAAAAAGHAPWAPMPCAIVNPYTRQPLRPSDVGFVKIDAEGFDGRVLYGLRRSLAAGLASHGGLMLELHPKAEECDAGAIVDYLEGELGFAYLHGGGNGVNGSRWLAGARLRRQVHAARTNVRCNVKGHTEAALEGLWLRGDMYKRALLKVPAPPLL